MKKILFLFFLLIVGLNFAVAATPIKGIFATYDGAETSYKLSDFPKVVYEQVGGVKHAVLYLKGQSTSVLSVPLVEGKQLVIVYGEYTTNSIDGIVSNEATIVEKDGKKYIQGGKIVIIGNDGKMYDATGKLLER